MNITPTRQFTYFNHKDNYPLQLKGNMLKKTRNLSNYCNREETGQKQMLSDQARKNIVEKIAKKQTNYSNWKYSCLPFEDKYGKRVKKQAIKTYQQKQNCKERFSGASYLFNRSSTQNNLEKERKHLRQWSSFRKQRKQKKHYYEANSSALFPKESLAPSQKSQAGRQINQRRQSESLINKINYDLHSDFEAHQSKQQPLGKKVGRSSLFRQGIEIGYDMQKQRPISKQKLNEMAGNIKINSIGTQSIKESHQIRKQDWRRNSLHIG